MSIWSGVLDSCPGLLCCVINLTGKLLYVSNGYKAVAQRLFGHQCTLGSIYPPKITQLDKALNDILMAACLGNTDAVEISEKNKIWSITASPLKIENKIEGVVIIINSESSGEQAYNSQNDPKILDSVPFRACVVNSSGNILAVNKFLAASSKNQLTGKNIIEFVDADSSSHLINIIQRRKGNIECRIEEIFIQENFCDEEFLDQELNAPKTLPQSFRVARLHATPIKWNGSINTLITFEDVTEQQRIQDQLRRLLTFDTSTGILNRRGIEHIIRREFTPAIHGGESLSVIQLGVVSDNLGTRRFVEKLKNFLKPHSSSSIARWSENEFTVLVHCKGAAAVVIANEFLEQTNGILIAAGVSDLQAGVYPGVKEFIGAAREAMLVAKEAGGNMTLLAENKNS